MRLQLVGFLALAGVLWVPRAQAELFVEFSNINIPGGGTGIMDVYIHSDVPQPIALSSYRFEISGFHVSGLLRFSPTSEQPSGSTVQNTVAPYPYLFQGDTDPLWYGINRLDPDYHLIYGADNTDSFGDVILGSSKRLLTRLKVEHISPTPLVASGEYMIKLKQHPGFTFFQDSNFDAVIPINPVSYTNFGKVTINAIPEPSSSVIAGLIGASTVFAGWRRRRHHRANR